MIKSILSRWQQRKRAKRCDLFIQKDMPRGKGEPHSRTANGLMSDLLGIAPGDHAIDSDNLKALRYVAQQELKLILKDKAKVKQCAKS